MYNKIIFNLYEESEMLLLRKRFSLINGLDKTEPKIEMYLQGVSEEETPCFIVVEVCHRRSKYDNCC